MKKYMLVALLVAAPWQAFSASMDDALKNEKNDPFQEFAQLHTVAKDFLASDQRSELLNTVSLATVDSNGYPQQRHMSLSMVDNSGFKFKTHEHATMVKQLEANNKASILFLWPHNNSYIQIRVSGMVEKLKPEGSSSKTDKTQQLTHEYILKPETVQFDKGEMGKDSISTSSIRYKHEKNGSWLVSRVNFTSPYSQSTTVKN
jgi:hypothetical protein